MQKVVVIRDFAAEPQAVWDVYTNHSRWNEWTDIRHSSLEVEGHPQKNGRGAIRRFGGFGVYAHEKIIDFDPPRKLTYTVLKGGLPMKYHLGEVLLEPNGGHTKLTWNCTFDSKIPGLGWLFRLYVYYFFRSALDGLAKHSFPDQAPARRNSF